MSNRLKADSTSSSPAHSPTSSISSFEEETYLESPLFSAERPFDAGTYRDGYTELNTTIVSEAKQSIVPPAELEEAVELDAGLYTQDLDSRSADPRRSRTSSNKRVSTSGTGKSTTTRSDVDGHGERGFAASSPQIPLRQRPRVHSSVGPRTVLVETYPTKSRRAPRLHRRSGEPRMVQIPVCGCFRFSQLKAFIKIPKISVFPARDFFLIIGLCVVLASAMILIARPAIYTVYEQSNILI
jgi:hypothetical protein